MFRKRSAHTNEKRRPLMSIKLGNVTILVRDYDEALKFYTDALGFEKRSDQKFGPGARWVTVGAPGQDVQIILQKPEPAMHGEENARKMTERIGQNPTWVLATIVARPTNCTLPGASSSASRPRTCLGEHRRSSRICTAIPTRLCNRGLFPRASRRRFRGGHF
jgi:hypothetical protein